MQSLMKILKRLLQHWSPASSREAGDAVVDHCVGSAFRHACLSINDQCQSALSMGRYSTHGNIDAKSILDKVGGDYRLDNRGLKYSRSSESNTGIP